MILLRGVIFDFDGTLANTLPVCFAAHRQTFATFLGRTYSDAELHGLGGPSDEGIIQGQLPDRWDTAMDAFLIAYEQTHTQCPTIFPGLELILDLLDERGVAKAIVSGKSARAAAISLRLLGLQGRFSIVETGSPEGPIKPYSIAQVLAAWGYPAASVAYVGDSPYDVDAARQAGVIPISAAWAPTADVAMLRAAQPVALFETVAAFATWLDQATGREQDHGA